MVAKFAGAWPAIVVLAAGVALIARFYFGLAPGRLGAGRKRRPYRGPSTKRARADARRGRGPGGEGPSDGGGAA